MNYKKKVQEKLIGSTERTEERIELWQKISEAYEKGGADQAKSSIAEMASKLKSDFEEVIVSLNKML